MTEELRPRAFNNQHVLKRIAIVAAGPLANLLLAVLLYWVVLGQGVSQVKPLVGTVVAQTPAAAAGFAPGDRILSIAGQPVANWQQIRLAFVEAAMSPDATVVRVETAAGAKAERRIDPARFGDKAVTAMQQGSTGLTPGRFLAVIGALEDGGAAQSAGLKAGDKLLALNGQALNSWEGWVTQVRNSRGAIWT